MDTKDHRYIFKASRNNYANVKKKMNQHLNTFNIISNKEVKPQYNNNLSDIMGKSNKRVFSKNTIKLYRYIQNKKP